MDAMRLTTDHRGNLVYEDGTTTGISGVILQAGVPNDDGDVYSAEAIASMVKQANCPGFITTGHVEMYVGPQAVLTAASGECAECGRPESSHRPRQ